VRPYAVAKATLLAKGFYESINIGVGPDEQPYLYDVCTKKILVGSPIDGAFLNGTVSSGWLDSAERIRYVFI
jgi:hypothetical protein